MWRKADRLGGLTPQVWDGLAGPHFYSTARWLTFCATDFGRGSHAAVAYQRGRATCAVPYAEVQDSLPGAYRWDVILARAELAAPPLRGLLVGSREGYQTHLLTGGAQVSTEVVQDLVTQLRAAVPTGDGTGPACMAMYVSSDDALALGRAGVTATPVMLETDAWIPLGDHGWSSWSDGIPPKRRGNLRREVQAFREAGYRIEHMPLRESIDLLGGLPSATLAKYGHDNDPVEELRALRHHVECMGDAAVTALCWNADDVLVGFCLYYVWLDTIFLRWAGFDYRRLLGAGEYFNICYYAQIERAEQLGVRQLHAGVKSAEAKALRGAVLRPLWLLDLTEDSPLGAQESRIRRHNGEALRRLVTDPRTADAVDETAWEPFV
jgi:hypothetical protein